MGKIFEILNKEYFDVNNKYSFTSKNIFTKYIIKKYKINKNKIEEWFKSNDIYTKFKNKKNNFKRLKIISPSKGFQWQADLLQMNNLSRYNNGIKYILITIDILSKYAHYYLLKNKNSNSVLEGFKKIFKKEKPKRIQTDQGKEFVNKDLKKYFNQQKIIHFLSTDGDIKCAVIERLNRTIRNKINKYLYYNKTYKYIDVIDKIFNNYNNSYHSSIKTSPSNVNKSNEKKIFNILYGNLKVHKPKKILKPGSIVRISKKKNLFEKGTTTNFTDELFIIKTVIDKNTHIIYKLIDFDGEEISSIFYPEEVVEAEKNSDYWEIEKIIEKKKNKKGKIEYLVKFKDYKNYYWIDDIKNV